jgi:hypothetical protein
VWEFVPETGHDEDETYVRPFRGTPKELSGCVAGCRVTLANGQSCDAIVGNVWPGDPVMTAEFLTASLWTGREWFHLARYHDVDRRRRGPQALARALGLRVADVFPIAYDLRRIVAGRGPALRGLIPAAPERRLSRTQRISLAVPRADG